MTRLAGGKAWLGAGVVALTALAAPQPAAAFFDELARAIFSGGPPVRAMRHVEPEMRFDHLAPSTRQRPVETAARPKPPAVKLEPAKDPYWYLKDPTLKRGDIVVTDRGPVVFQGRENDRHRVADFVSLDESRMVSKAARQLVSAATDTRIR